MRIGINRAVMKPRVRGGSHQHRQQVGAAVLERDLPRPEPRVKLRGVPGRPGQPVGRIDRPGPGRSHRTLSLNQRIDPGPPDPLGQHRRRHVWGRLEQLPNPWLDDRARRRHRRPHLPRRRIRVHRLDHRGRRDPQPLGDPAFGIIRQVPDQRPVLSDHSPIVECSLFTAETVQFSSAADSSQLVRPPWHHRVRVLSRNGARYRSRLCGSTPSPASHIAHRQVAHRPRAQPAPVALAAGT